LPINDNNKATFDNYWKIKRWAISKYPSNDRSYILTSHPSQIPYSHEDLVRDGEIFYIYNETFRDLEGQTFNYNVLMDENYVINHIILDQFLEQPPNIKAFLYDYLANRYYYDEKYFKAYNLLMDKLLYNEQPKIVNYIFSRIVYCSNIYHNNESNYSTVYQCVLNNFAVDYSKNFSISILNQSGARYFVSVEPYEKGLKDYLAELHGKVRTGTFQSAPPADNFIISVNNPNSYSLTNYQLRINISSIRDAYGDYFKIEDQNGNQVQFCFEQSNGECTTNPTDVIWVKIPYLPANDETRLYVYQDSKNNAVNGDQIFNFYDDFSNLDTNKWSVNRYANDVNHECVLENGVLWLTKSYKNRGCFIQAKNYNIKYNSKAVIEAHFLIPYNCGNSNDGDGLALVIDGKTTSAYRGCSKGFYDYKSPGIAFGVFDDRPNGDSNNGVALATGWDSCGLDYVSSSYILAKKSIPQKTSDMNDFTIQWKLSGSNYILNYYDNNPDNSNLQFSLTAPATNPNGQGYLQIGAGDGTSGCSNRYDSSQGIDWIRIREYADTEPTYTIIRNYRTEQNISVETRNITVSMEPVDLPSVQELVDKGLLNRYQVFYFYEPANEVPANYVTKIHYFVRVYIMDNESEKGNILAPESSFYYYHFVIYRNLGDIISKKINYDQQVNGSLLEVGTDFTNTYNDDTGQYCVGARNYIKNNVKFPITVRFNSSISYTVSKSNIITGWTGSTPDPIYGSNSWGDSDNLSDIIVLGPEEKKYVHTYLHCDYTSLRPGAFYCRPLAQENLDISKYETSVPDISAPKLYVCGYISIGDKVYTYPSDYVNDKCYAIGDTELDAKWFIRTRTAECSEEEKCGKDGCECVGCNLDSCIKGEYPGGTETIALERLYTSESIKPEQMTITVKSSLEAEELNKTFDGWGVQKDSGDWSDPKTYYGDSARTANCDYYTNFLGGGTPDYYVHPPYPSCPGCGDCDDCSQKNKDNSENDARECINNEKNWIVNTVIPNYVNKYTNVSFTIKDNNIDEAEGETVDKCGDDDNHNIFIGNPILPTPSCGSLSSYYTYLLIPVDLKIVIQNTNMPYKYYDYANDQVVNSTVLAKYKVTDSFYYLVMFEVSPSSFEKYLDGKINLIKKSTDIGTVYEVNPNDLTLNVEATVDNGVITSYKIVNENEVVNFINSIPYIYFQSRYKDDGTAIEPKIYAQGDLVLVDPNGNFIYISDNGEKVNSCSVGSLTNIDNTGKDIVNSFVKTGLIFSGDSLDHGFSLSNILTNAEVDLDSDNEFYIETKTPTKTMNGTFVYDRDSKCPVTQRGVNDIDYLGCITFWEWKDIQEPVKTTEGGSCQAMGINLEGMGGHPELWNCFEFGNSNNKIIVAIPRMFGSSLDFKPSQWMGKSYFDSSMYDPANNSYDFRSLVLRAWPSAVVSEVSSKAEGYNDLGILTDNDYLKNVYYYTGYNNDLSDDHFTISVSNNYITIAWPLASNPTSTLVFLLDNLWNGYGVEPEIPSSLTIKPENTQGIGSLQSVAPKDTYYSKVYFWYIRKGSVSSFDNLDPVVFNTLYYQQGHYLITENYRYIDRMIRWGETVDTRSEAFVKDGYLEQLTKNDFKWKVKTAHIDKEVPFSTTFKPLILGHPYYASGFTTALVVVDTRDMFYDFDLLWNYFTKPVLENVFNVKDAEELKEEYQDNEQAFVRYYLGLIGGTASYDIYGAYTNTQFDAKEDDYDTQNNNYMYFSARSTNYPNLVYFPITSEYYPFVSDYIIRNYEGDLYDNIKDYLNYVYMSAIKNIYAGKYTTKLNPDLMYAMSVDIDPFTSDLPVGVEGGVVETFPADPFYPIIGHPQETISQHILETTREDVDNYETNMLVASSNSELLNPVDIVMDSKKKDLVVPYILGVIVNGHAEQIEKNETELNGVILKIDVIKDQGYTLEVSYDWLKDKVLSYIRRNHDTTTYSQFQLLIDRLPTENGYVIPESGVGVRVINPYQTIFYYFDVPKIVNTINGYTLGGSNRDVPIATMGDQYSQLEYIQGKYPGLYYSLKAMFPFVFPENTSNIKYQEIKANFGEKYEEEVAQGMLRGNVLYSDYQTVLARGAGLS
jgi:hypothetical protein